MTRISATTSNGQSIHAALELSKNRWLLAIQVPGRIIRACIQSRAATPKG